MTSALEGLKVLDLTRVLAGPLCTMLLGDMGAEVTKVEADWGDETRGWGPPYNGGEAAYYLGFNRNKRSIVLDLKSPEGRTTLEKLLRESDVVVENFKAGTLARWGFGAEWREREAPGLIHCSITGYGETGEKAHMPGYDFILQAEAGLMSITGPVDGPPIKHGVAIVDLTTGLYAALGVLGALCARQRRGIGQQVSVSLFESALSMLANVAANHLASGSEARRYGNGHPNIVPYSIFPAADADVALAVGNDLQFERLSVICGHPEWPRDRRMRTNADRVENRALVEAAVGQALAQRPAQEWIELLTDAGIPCGRVNSVAGALASPQAAAREMVIDVQHPTASNLRLLGFPIKMDRTPLAVRRPPPLLGQHTDEVLAELGARAA